MDFVKSYFGKNPYFRIFKTETFDYFLMQVFLSILGIL